MAPHKSNLDLINECDNFPYPTSATYTSTLSTLYTLHIHPCPHPVGYILPPHALTLEELAFTSSLPEWTFDHTSRTVTLSLGFPASDLHPHHPQAEVARSEIMARTTAAMRESGQWKILKGWRDELYPIYGELNGERRLLCSVERAASALFGIVTYGCHMTAFVRNPSKGLQLWVPRRAKTKSTYPSMLDNTVAGGIATGERPSECIVREAEEEASLPAELVREKVKAVGMVTYFHVRDERAGGETGLCMPECQYVYDVDLTDAGEVVPKPLDGEVEAFELMGIDEVKQAMARGEFKPNCAVVLVDFYVRHGIITAEEVGEGEYGEICSRLHRRLEFVQVEGKEA